MTGLTATDLFAGAGGSSEGLTQAGYHVAIAANHWPVAVATHKLAHPNTEHRTADLSEVDWRTFPTTDIAWVSPSCFTAGHLIMTNRGQVPIEEVQEGDLVLTHRGRWRRVNKAMSKVADTLVVKGGGNYSVETTAEHPFYVKNRPPISAARDYRGPRRDDTHAPAWKVAESIGDADYLATPQQVDPLPIPEFDTRNIVGKAAFWWIVGRWLGDGWTRIEEADGPVVAPRQRTQMQPAGSPCVVCGEPAKINGNSDKFASPYCSRRCKRKSINRNRTRSRGWVTICCSKSEVDEMRAHLALVPELTWTSRENRTAWVFTTSYMAMSRWLVSEFGKYAHGKHLPAWVFGMNVEHRRALLDGYVSADGNVKRATQIGTVSHELAVDIRVLATSLGKIATLSKPTVRTRGVIEGREVNMRTLYTVQWATAPDPAKARTCSDGTHRWHPAKPVEPGRTAVPVYNISVEEDESYVVEGIVVHNCVWHARAGGRRRPPAEVERMRQDAGAIDRATAFAVVAAAEVHKYSVILIENVPEFCNWSLYRWWLDGLRVLGYTRITPLILDAADYGHAQHRKRLFIVATRDGLHVDLTPPAMAKVQASAILDEDPGKPVTRQLYVSPQIAQIADEDVPHLVTYRRNARAKRADLHPIATVTAGGNQHAVARIRDGRAWHRMLTNRECARAQGFPDTYEFIGTGAEVKRQIGNAVPVGIARWLGNRVAAAMGCAEVADTTPLAAFQPALFVEVA